MSDWRSILKADPTDWLLAGDNPSVRYFALTDILDIPHENAEVKEAGRAIMERGVVPAILARQEDGGYWEEPDRFYNTKYKGTVWQLIILAELGADGNDQRIKRAVEFILENSQDLESHGFAMHRSAQAGGGRHSEVIPCLTGNMVWSMIRFGYLADLRIQRAVEWIVTYQRFDDSIAGGPEGWPYDKAEPCWGRHTCHMGAVKALKALAEIPAGQRSGGVKMKIEEGVEYILVHHIHKRSHDLSRVSKPGWLRFGFPLMYQTDVLEILGILTGLGYRDARMQEALDLVISKQDSQGRWLLQNTFNGRFQKDIEQKGKPSKWITLNALRVLKNYYSEE